MTHESCRLTSVSTGKGRRVKDAFPGNAKSSWGLSQAAGSSAVCWLSCATTTTMRMVSSLEWGFFASSRSAPFLSRSADQLLCLWVAGCSFRFGFSGYRMGKHSIRSIHKAQAEYVLTSLWTCHIVIMPHVLPGWVRKNQKVMCNLKILKHWVPNMIWLYLAIFGYRSIVSISGYTFRLAYFHIDNCWLPHPPGALLKTIQAEMWGTSSGYIWLVLWNMFFPYIGNFHLNWRTPSFFTGVGIPPTSN